MNPSSLIQYLATNTIDPVVIFTHGNLMTLILKHFNGQIGYAEWENLQNPDLYCVKFSSEGTFVKQMIAFKTNRTPK